MLNERIKKIAFSIIWQNCPLVKINMSLIQVRAIIAKINRRKILLARKLIGAKFPTLIPSKWGISHFHTTKIAVRALHGQIFARINICDHQSWRTIIFAKKNAWQTSSDHQFLNGSKFYENISGNLWNWHETSILKKFEIPRFTKISVHKIGIILKFVKINARQIVEKAICKYKCSPKLIIAKILLKRDCWY